MQVSDPPVVAAGSAGCNQSQESLEAGEASISFGNIPLLPPIGTDSAGCIARLRLQVADLFASGDDVDCAGS